MIKYPWGYFPPTPEEYGMCRAVACKECGKTTWAGCGQHVDSVMRGVAPKDRCQGHERTARPGLFGRLFGKA